MAEESVDTCVKCENPIHSGTEIDVDGEPNHRTCYLNWIMGVELGGLRMRLHDDFHLTWDDERITWVDMTIEMLQRVYNVLEEESDE